MIPVDGEQAGRALSLSPLDAPITGVSIDSRTLKPGELFVALRGERFDGHEYVEAAFAAGASGAIVDKREWNRLTAHESGARQPVSQGGCDSGRSIYEVDDTLAALGSLAREVRRASGATVFAITGSVGKTSTKDMLKAMLGRVLRVTATSGNQNNEVGVPLTLLGLEPETQAVIVEMGMRGLGQIADLAAITEPDVGIITNIHPVHLELLGSLENVAKAKAELVTGLKPGGVVVVPAGSEVLEPLLEGCACRLVRFCVAAASDEAGPNADVVGWLEQGDTDGEYLWGLRWPEGEARVAVEHMAKHSLENAVAAAAACYAARLPVQECMVGIGQAAVSEGRGQMVDVGGLVVIDDTYNANPAAMRAAVQHLVDVARARHARAVAVLGDMLELGAESATYHEQVGEYAAAVGVAALWGVGPMASSTVEGFRRQRQEHSATDGEWSAERLASCDEADKLLAGLRVGDVVLVKGSRGVHLENVVARIAGEGQAGRWGGGTSRVDVGGDSTREKRHC